jgi:hypothetical protein
MGFESQQFFDFSKIAVDFPITLVYSDVEVIGKSLEEVIRMVRLDMLAREINQSGLKKVYIAQSLGLTAQGLSNKLDGCSAFKVDEAKTLSDLLHLSVERRDEIFFA